MKISVTERLSLGKELSELMSAQKSATAVQRVTIGVRIVEVMMKLGLGSSDNPAQQQGEEVQPAAQETPKIVADFLSGAFTKSSQMEFIDALRGISQYIGEFLTLDQAKEQTVNWVSANGYAA